MKEEKKNATAAAASAAKAVAVVKAHAHTTLLTKQEWQKEQSIYFLIIESLSDV